MAADLAPTICEEMQGALERERERLVRTIRSLAAAESALARGQAEEEAVHGDPGDVASNLVEREVDLALEGAERDRLHEVEAALRRLATGHYGTCATCGRRIEPGRLRVLPWTRQCLACASRAVPVGVGWGHA